MLLIFKVRMYRFGDTLRISGVVEGASLVTHNVYCLVEVPSRNIGIGCPAMSLIQWVNPPR